MGMRERFTGKHALNIYTRFYSRMFREHEIIQPHLMYITRFLSDPIDDSRMTPENISDNFYVFERPVRETEDFQNEHRKKTERNSFRTIRF